MYEVVVHGDASSLPLYGFVWRPMPLWYGKPGKGIITTPDEQHRNFKLHMSRVQYGLDMTHDQTHLPVVTTVRLQGTLVSPYTGYCTTCRSDI